MDWTSTYQVGKVPAGEIDHEDVERLADPLSGHGDDGSEVDDDAQDGHGQAGGTVDPELQPINFQNSI